MNRVYGCICICSLKLFVLVLFVKLADYSVDAKSVLLLFMSRV